jgi:hypothetical protein
MRIFEDGSPAGEAMATILFKDANSLLSKLIEESDCGRSACLM